MNRRMVESIVRIAQTPDMFQYSDGCNPPHVEPVLETTSTWGPDIEKALEITALRCLVHEWAEKHASEISHKAYEELKEVLK